MSKKIRRIYAYLASAPILLDLIGLGLDVATTKRSSAVIVGGETISLGGSSVTAMKRSLAEYDFTALEFSERLAIYDEAKAAIAWPVFKNLLLGFGSGSKSQGDRGGVLAGTILDATSLGALGVGIGFVLVDILLIAPFSAIGDAGYNPFDDRDNELMQIAGGLVIGGLIGLGVGRIIQAVLPISYGTRYNTALRNGLGIDTDGGDALSLSVALNASNLGIGFSIASRVRF